MATTITAGNATNGFIVTPDNTGILELKTGTGSGTTALTLSTAQAATFAGAVSVTGNATLPTIRSNAVSTPPTIQDSAGTEIGTFCRAFVNFNGTGTVAIRASFNVTSITDNNTGDYTVNFTTAMPDANYSVNANNSPNFAGAFPCGAALFSNGTPTETAPTTSAARVFFGNTAGAAYDPKYACISIFR